MYSEKLRTHSKMLCPDHLESEAVNDIAIRDLLQVLKPV